jgi:hypothetical protein
MICLVLTRNTTEIDMTNDIKNLLNDIAAIRHSDAVINGMNDNRATRWTRNMGHGLTVRDIAVDVFNNLGSVDRWVRDAVNHDENAKVVRGIEVKDDGTVVEIFDTTPLERQWELARLNLETVMEGSGGLLSDKQHRLLKSINSLMFKAEAA